MGEQRREDPEVDPIDMQRVDNAIMRWCGGNGIAAKEEGFTKPHEDFLRLIAGLLGDVRRETIAQIEAAQAAGVPWRVTSHEPGCNALVGPSGAGGACSCGLHSPEPHDGTTCPSGCPGPHTMVFR